MTAATPLPAALAEVLAGRRRMARPRSLRIGRLAIYGGMVSRGNNGENPPWLGFCYGSWLPIITWPNRQSAAWCVDARWLCFSGSAYWNDKLPRKSA